jgi:DNA replication protein DnaC
MNNNQTLEKLREMRLLGMAQLHAQNIQQNKSTDWTADEYLAYLTDHEWENRQNKKIDRLMQSANFRQKSSVADIDYNASRNLDKNMFTRIATLAFIDKKENLIITGSTGVGKSYIAQALGHQACLNGLRVMYSTASRLFSRLKLCKVDGTYLKEINKFNNKELIIIDDFGLQAFDNFARETLLEIIDERFNKGSMIIASQIPVSSWYEIIGENTIADAILDRLINTSHRIDLKGDSMRKGMIDQL